MEIGKFSLSEGKRVFDPASLGATPRQVWLELALFLALLALNWVCFGLNWV